MAKSINPKKSADAAEKSNASYSTKSTKPAQPDSENPSKFQPGEEVDLDYQALDASDGVLKLFTDGIRDIYWAENHLVKSIPKLINAASYSGLQTALSNHLEETKSQVVRLEKVFELLGKAPQAKKCDAMEGLTKEGEGVIESTDTDSPARNLGIIMAGQKTEHYEIASYTGLIKLAGRLGLDEIVSILNETLAEEDAADKKLAEIADSETMVDLEDGNTLL